MLLKKFLRLFDRGFIIFSLIGFAGFFVDATVLTVLTLEFKWSIIPARLMSFALATMMTWVLNRTYAFSSCKKKIIARKMEYVRYFLVQAVGASLNLFIFLCLLTWMPLLHQVLLIPLGVGAAVALIFNYFMTKMFVFENTGV